MERWTKCICLVIVFIQTFIEAYAYDFESNGVTYDIISATSLTCEVSGITDSTQTHVSIPETVNYREREFNVIQIGEKAFESSEIESISLPECIAVIGKSAFEGSRLAQIEFPRSLQKIEERAFYNTLIKSVKLDFSSSCSIGRNSFSNCPSLELVNICSNVELFDHNWNYDGDRSYGVFKDNQSLKSVNIDGNLETIPSYTFSDCDAIHDFNIIGKVSYVQGHAWISPIEDLNISGYVGRLGDALYSTYEIPCESLTISGRVTSVNGNFTSTLKEATLTGEIEYLGGFRNCNQLKSLVIPNSVTSIEGFAGCSSLSHLVLSDSISELEDKMFDGCTSLKELIIPSSVKNMKTRSNAYGSPDPLIPLEWTSLIIKGYPKDKRFSLGNVRLDILCPLLEKLVLERDIYDNNASFNNSLNVITTVH